MMGFMIILSYFVHSDILSIAILYRLIEILGEFVIHGYFISLNSFYNSFFLVSGIFSADFTYAMKQLNFPFLPFSSHPPNPSVRLKHFLGKQTISRPLQINFERLCSKPWPVPA